MTDLKRERTRLYLITPPDISDAGEFADLFERTLEGGDVASLQVRIKPHGQFDAAKTEEVAKRLLPVCRANDIALIINDSVDICESIGADGVHLGHSDMRVKDARKRLGKTPIIGATAKNSRHVAMEAGEQGADYVAFGAFFPSRTKADTVPAETDLLNWWQAVMEIPCVAIGGIMPKTAGEIAVAGADFVAVSSAVWSHPGGPAEAVTEFNSVFDQAEAEF